MRRIISTWPPAASSSWRPPSYSRSPLSLPLVLACWLACDSIVIAKAEPWSHFGRGLANWLVSIDERYGLRPTAANRVLLRARGLARVQDLARDKTLDQIPYFNGHDDKYYQQDGVLFKQSKVHG